MSIDAGTVLILITVLVLPIAAIAFARAGGAWRQLGKGAFAIEQRREAPARPAGAAERRLQEAEARQMLEAKSYRRQRSGLGPIDVEAELAVLLEASAEPEIDEELRDEVRRLVIARNERRMRRGE